MKAAPALTNDPAQLHVMIHEMQQSITLLKEQLYLSLHRQYGRSADVVDIDQHALFESAEIEVLPLPGDEVVLEASDTTQDKTPAQRERRGLRINTDLPTERVDIELPQPEQICDDCGGELHDIGTEVSTRLEYIPATLIKKELHRHKYGCRGCEGGIKRAALPASPIPKSQASSSLLAHLITAKYADHLPLHRIERQLHRLGLVLPRRTQGDWMMACGVLVQPLIDQMAREVRDRGHIYTDDTTLPLQNDIPGR